MPKRTRQSRAPRGTAYPTAIYTAPELVDGAVADERADLYSLGAPIYEMAAGHPPFGGTREEVLAARRAGMSAPSNWRYRSIVAGA